MNKGSTTGQIFLKYHRSDNPVTKAVYAEILAKRLDRQARQDA